MMGGSFLARSSSPAPTRRSVGGEARLNMLFWLNGGNRTGHNHQRRRHRPSSRRAAQRKRRGPHARRQRLTISPQQSKISVETRTPTAWGEARTFIRV